MTLLMIAPILLHVLAACGYAALGWRPATAWLGAVASAGTLCAAIALAVATTDHPRTAIGGLLRADALSAFMLIVIGVVALLAMLASPGYLAAEVAAGHTGERAARRYGILTQAFVAAMALAVLAASLGVLWVAVEATTILTAFLVGHRRTRQAVEAAWKYVVICSVGIALALLGIVLTNYAAVHARVPSAGVLDWAVLAGHAADLDPGVMRIAVALLVLGFGTKAGLAPMHAWLPDAHGQAPAPVSALMSGVLLSVAFYAVLRVKVIADIALGAGFARTLLVIAALASLAVSAALLLAQRDYKRMLAYSSIEHMGLVALGAAIGTRLAMAAVLLHVLGHGLGKSVLFLASGHIHQAYGSSKIAAVGGLTVRAPVLAGAFGLGLLALLGLPPFSLFASELGIVRAGFSAGLGWAVAAALVLVLLIGASMLSGWRSMLLGTPSPEGAAPLPAVVTNAAGGAAPPGQATPSPGGTSPRLTWTAAVPLVAGLLACAVLGVTTGPLRPLLEAAATMAGATP
ncbi:proton-conducting transporter transmembrane domain-containing protein [Sphaerisporangium perillae]|uniref:proton-conducting transporter transmembrane domain-containing protein n=1 Tax=Sphaerisporangium perillae TaxID=2935860 RepID=UPI00200F92DA|nr:proton-conducting transporter membrane subunit [Sphaerisporangium perillae]